MDTLEEILLILGRIRGVVLTENGGTFTLAEYKPLLERRFHRT